MVFSKKGMGVGQVFIFIIAGFTFAFIAIFGYKVVSDFVERGEQVEFVAFKNDLETAVQEIYSDYGAVRVRSFSPPSMYRQICFVDMNYDYNQDDFNALCEKDLFACEIWKEANLREGYSSVDVNVFLTPAPMGRSDFQIKTYPIEIFNLEQKEKLGFFCFEIKNSGFELTLEGRGDKTRIII